MSSVVGTVTRAALQLSFHENFGRFLLGLMRHGLGGHRHTNESIAYMSPFMFYDMIMVDLDSGAAAAITGIGTINWTVGDNFLSDGLT